MLPPSGGTVFLFNVFAVLSGTKHSVACVLDPGLHAVFLCVLLGDMNGEKILSSSVGRVF